MPFEQPANTDLEAWYVAARRIDQVQLANEAFQSTLWLMTMTPACSASTQLTSFSVLCSPLAALPSVLPRPPPPPPIPSEGIPIDIDAVWKMRSLSLRGCYRCEEANYFMKDCPYRLDIQRLTAEKREELIEDLMALKDIVKEEKVCSAPEEDFA